MSYITLNVIKSINLNLRPSSYYYYYYTTNTLRRPYYGHIMCSFYCKYSDASIMVSINICTYKTRNTLINVFPSWKYYIIPWATTTKCYRLFILNKKFLVKNCRKNHAIAHTFHNYDVYSFHTVMFSFCADKKKE